MSESTVAPPKAPGLYDSKSSSMPQKVVMQALSWAAVAAVFYMLVGGGMARLAAALGARWAPGSGLRAWLLVACSTVYALRLVVTQFVLIKRTMPWSEAATISAWLWVIHGTFVYFGGRNAAAPGAVAWLGLALYAFGSYLNTGSELMRHQWKKRPESKGRLYTEGLFKHSMHINYFGDFVLFTGFAMVAGSPWALAIPLTMAGMFVFLNIPMLDAYLAERYGAQFTEYASKTRKFIPYVY